jgi:CheY-like chemotaxis protein
MLNASPYSIEESTPVAPQSSRILLIEDSDADVFLVRRALNGVLPYELQLARDGEAAFGFLDGWADDPAAEWPDLILLDLNLPRIDGFQVLSRIRQNPRLAAIPVIVMTSSDSPADREKMFRLGATVYFRKPTDLNAFMELGPLSARILNTGR